MMFFHGDLIKDRSREWLKRHGSNLAFFVLGSGFTLFVQYFATALSAAARWGGSGGSTPTWRRDAVFIARVEPCPNDHYDTEAWLSRKDLVYRIPALRECRTIKPAAWRELPLGGAARLTARLFWPNLDSDASETDDCRSSCSTTQGPDRCDHWCRYFDESHLAIFREKVRALATVVPALHSGAAHALLDVGGGSGLFGVAAAQEFGALTTTTAGIFRFGESDGYKPFGEFIASHDLPFVVHDFTAKYPFPDSS